MSLTGVVQSPSEGELLECILKIHNGAREVGDRASPMAIADRHCITHKTQDQLPPKAQGGGYSRGAYIFHSEPNVGAPGVEGIAGGGAFDARTDLGGHLGTRRAAAAARRPHDASLDPARPPLAIRRGFAFTSIQT